MCQQFDLLWSGTQPKGEFRKQKLDTSCTDRLFLCVADPATSAARRCLCPFVHCTNPPVPFERGCDPARNWCPRRPPVRVRGALLFGVAVVLFCGGRLRLSLFFSLVGDPRLWCFFSVVGDAVCVCFFGARRDPSVVVVIWIEDACRRGFVSR